MIKSENVDTKCKDFSKKLISSAVVLAMMLPSISASYANPEEEEKGSIRVYRTPNKAGTLVAPQHVEYLEANPAQKKLTVFHTDKEPQEINSAFRPSSFPWQLSYENMETFLGSQSFLLKQLDDGEYKLDMHTIGQGGILPLAVIAASPYLTAAVVAAAPYIPTAMQFAQNSMNRPGTLKYGVIPTAKKVFKKH